MADFTPIGVEAIVEGLNTFNRNIDQMNKKISSVETTSDNLDFSSIGTKVAAAGAAVAAAAAVAVAAIGGIALAVGKVSFDFASDAKQGIKDLEAQLGLTTAEAQKLGDVAQKVFLNNFGEDIGDATAAVGLIRQQLGDLSDVELQDATENALRIRDAFGVDVSESLQAVKTLTQEFGLSQQEAFDFVAAGFQKGLNSSDDFIDSITEYGVLFGQGGAQADQFFSLLETGLNSGVLGTDKAADAYKEFQIRFTEANDDLIAGLGALGLDYDSLVVDIQSGNKTMVDVFGEVTSQVNQTDMSILSNQAAVAKLGTQFEDLGTNAVGAIDLTNTKLSELSGSTDKLDAQYENLPARFETLKRQVLVSLQPIGDKLLELAEVIFPYLEKAIVYITDTVIPALVSAFDTVTGWFTTSGPEIETSTDSIFGGIKEIMNIISDEIIPKLKQAFDIVARWFEDNESEINAIVDSIFNGMSEIMYFLIDTVIPDLVRMFGTIIDWFIAHETEFRAVLDVWMKIFEGLAIAFNAVVDGIQIIWTSILKPLLELIGVFYGTWVDTISALLTGDLVGAFNAVADGLSAVFGSDGIAMTILFGFDELVQTLIIGLLDAILNLFGSSYDEFASIWQGIWDNIKLILETSFTSLGEVIISGLVVFARYFTDAKRDLADAMQEAMDAVLDVIGGMVDDAKKLFEGLTDGLGKVVEELTSLPAKAGQIATDFMAGLAKGIEDAQGVITSAISSLAQAMIDKFKDKFGISSPSKVMTELGYNMGEGLALGITSSTTLVNDALDSLLDIGGDISGISRGFASEIESGLLADIQAQLASKTSQRDLAISELTRILGVSEDELLKGTAGKSALSAILANPSGYSSDVVALANALTQRQSEVVGLQEEELALQEKLLQVEKQRSDLNFLQQQLDLLDLITEHGLNPEDILGGLELGLEADVGALLDATIAATQAIINEAESQLGIASPSKVFKRIGQQTMEGLTQGLMSLGQMPAQVMSMATGLMTQRASAPNVMTSQANTFNTTINSQMDAAQFQAMLNRSLGNAIA